MHFTFHIRLFIISPRWHRKDDTLVDWNECSNILRQCEQTTYDILDRVEWPRQMKMAYKWHLMKRIVTLFYLFFFFFVLPSHWFIAGCVRWNTHRERARSQHLYYFIRTRTLARTRQLKYSVWFVVCVFFSSQTHTCVTRGVDVTVNLYWRKTSSVYGNDSLCHVFAGPETIFKKHIMKRCQRQRRTEDTSSLKLLSFAAFFHLPYFFSSTFESNKSKKKITRYYFFGRLVLRVTFFPSEMSRLMILLRMHFLCVCRSSVRLSRGFPFSFFFVLLTTKKGQRIIRNDESFPFY